MVSAEGASPWLIVVTGPAANGKSTLAAWLGEQLSLPFISKDGIKEILFDTLGWRDREWSKWLGRASVEVLFYFVRVLLARSQSMVLENVFHPEMVSATFQALQHDTGCGILQIICAAEPAVNFERFRQRAELGVRHPGHVDLQCLDEFTVWLQQERSMRLEVEGPVIEVDTTEWAAVSYEAILKQIRSHLNRSEGRSTTRPGDAAIG